MEAEIIVEIPWLQEVGLKNKMPSNLRILTELQELAAVGNIVNTNTAYEQERLVLKSFFNINHFHAKSFMGDPPLVTSSAIATILVK